MDGLIVVYSVNARYQDNCGCRRCRSLYRRKQRFDLFDVGVHDSIFHLPFSTITFPFSRFKVLAAMQLSLPSPPRGPQPMITEESNSGKTCTQMPDRKSRILI